MTHGKGEITCNAGLVYRINENYFPQEDKFGMTWSTILITHVFYIDKKSYLIGEIVSTPNFSIKFRIVWKSFGS